MPPLLIANDFLYATLALLAVLLARRDRRAGRLTAYIVWMAATGLLVTALRWLPRGQQPLHGLQRIVFHLNEAITLSWSFFFVACCVHYFVQRRSRWIAALWVVAVAILALRYPTYTGTKLLAVYSTVAAATLVLSIGAVLWGMFGRPELEVGLPHLVLLLYVLTDGAMRAVSFAHLVAHWDISRVANITLLMACIIAHGYWLIARTEARAQ